MRFGGGTQGPLWAVFLPPWPCGGGHLGGAATKWGGRGAREARGPRGGAPGGAALTFAPGRAAGAGFFFRGVPSEISG
jgi:hypothetical protein